MIRTLAVSAALVAATAAQAEIDPMLAALKADESPQTLHARIVDPATKQPGSCQAGGTVIVEHEGYDNVNVVLRRGSAGHREWHLPRLIGNPKPGVSFMKCPRAESSSVWFARVFSNKEASPEMDVLVYRGR